MPESGDERIVEELVDQVLAATISGNGGDLPDAAREEMQILGEAIRKLPAPKQDQLFLLLKGHSDSLVRTDLHQCQALCAAMELLAAVVAEIRHQALVQRAVAEITRLFRKAGGRSRCYGITRRGLTWLA
jgi:hypothetical protein